MTTWTAHGVTEWTSLIAPYSDPEFTLTEVLAEDLSSSTGAVGSTAASVVGSRAGTPIPASACALVNLTIQRRYRGGKPRIYLPVGMSGDVSTGQNWGTTFTTNLLSAYQALVTNMISAPPGATTITGQVNVSYYSGFTVRNPGGGVRAKNIPTLRVTPVVDAVLASSINPRFASQRRRNRP
jgi:hypothetical protein